MRPMQFSRRRGGQLALRACQQNRRSAGKPKSLMILSENGEHYDPVRGIPGLHDGVVRRAK
jgi:hypothetical protein